MNDKPEYFPGWRFICVKHQWRSNQMPCPDGDGTDRGPQEKP